MTNYAEIWGVRCRKSFNYVEKTLDYAEISTVNKTDNKLHVASLLNVPNNRETNSTSKSHLQFKFFN